VKSQSKSNLPEPSHMALVLSEEQSMLARQRARSHQRQAPVAHLRQLRDEKNPDGSSAQLWRRFAEMDFPACWCRRSRRQRSRRVEAGADVWVWLRRAPRRSVQSGGAMPGGRHPRCPSNVSLRERCAAGSCATDPGFWSSAARQRPSQKAAKVVPRNTRNTFTLLRRTASATLTRAQSTRPLKARKCKALRSGKG